MGCGASTANVAELEAQVKKAENSKKAAEDELKQLRDITTKEIAKLKAQTSGGDVSKDVFELERKLRAAEEEIKKLKDSQGSGTVKGPPAAATAAPPSTTAPAANPAAPAPAATPAAPAAANVKTNGPSSGSVLRIILLGPPACGKGKQADLILQKYGLAHISPGVVLREASHEDTPLGNEIKAAIKAKVTVPDNLTVQALKNKVLSADVAKTGFLLDGYPRTVEQAKLLKQHGVPIDKIVLVDPSQQGLVEKLSSRWLDPVTGLFYDMRANPPQEEEVTSRLIQRADDQEPVIRSRLESFFSNISDIERELGLSMERVNGDKSEEEVFAEVQKVLR